MTTQEKLKVIVKAIDAKLGDDIKILKVTDLTIVADYFVIAQGNSSTQVKAIADEVDYKMSLEGIEPFHKDGFNSTEWIVLDYGEIIVHMFYKQTREFYNLDKLWSDAEEIDISNFV